VEMVSTGEVACFGQDVHEAFLLAMMSAGFKLPKNKRVLFTIGPLEEKMVMVESARQLVDAGFTLFGSEGTHHYFTAKGVQCNLVKRIVENDEAKDILELITSRSVDLVINVSDPLMSKDLSYGYLIRRASVDFGVPLVTNAKVAEMLIQSLIRVKKVPCYSMGDFYQLGMPSVTKIKALHHRERLTGTYLSIQE